MGQNKIPIQKFVFFNLFSTDFTINTHINCISIVLHQGHDFHLEKDQKKPKNLHKSSICNTVISYK